MISNKEKGQVLTEQIFDLVLDNAGGCPTDINHHDIYNAIKYLEKKYDHVSSHAIKTAAELNSWLWEFSADLWACFKVPFVSSLNKIEAKLIYKGLIYHIDIIYPGITEFVDDNADDIWVYLYQEQNKPIDNDFIRWLEEKAAFIYRDDNGYVKMLEWTFGMSNPRELAEDIQYKVLIDLCIYPELSIESDFLLSSFIDSSSEFDLMGVKDNKGNVIIPADFAYIGDFSEGYASAQSSDFYYELKQGCIDASGKLVIPYDYLDIGLFKNGLAPACKSNGKYGMINKKGETIVPMIYDELYGYVDGLIIAKLHNKYGWIDKDGNKVIEIKYDSVNIFCENYAAVKLNGKTGLINRFGDVVIPIIYDSIGNCKESKIAIMSNSKWGFINLKNEIIVPIHYDAVQDFSEGMAGVRMNEKCGFINQFGVLAIDLLYDDILNFSMGLASVKRSSKWGYIDINNEVWIPFDYDHSCNYTEGLAAVNKNGKWGYVNRYNDIVIPFLFDSAYSFQNGIAFVKIKDEEFYINREGERI